MWGAVFTACAAFQSREIQKYKYLITACTVVPSREL